MKKYLVFIAFVLVLACGRYDKQYSKVISPNETLCQQKLTVSLSRGYRLPVSKSKTMRKTVELSRDSRESLSTSFIIQIETEYVEVETKLSAKCMLSIVKKMLI